MIWDEFEKLVNSYSVSLRFNWSIPIPSNWAGLAVHQGRLGVGESSFGHPVQHLRGADTHVKKTYNIYIDHIQPNPHMDCKAWCQLQVLSLSLSLWGPPSPVNFSLGLLILIPFVRSRIEIVSTYKSSFPGSAFPKRCWMELFFKDREIKVDQCSHWPSKTKTKIRAIGHYWSFCLSMPFLRHSSNWWPLIQTLDLSPMKHFSIIRWYDLTFNTISR